MGVHGDRFAGLELEDLEWLDDQTEWNGEAERGANGNQEQADRDILHDFPRPGTHGPSANHSSQSNAGVPLAELSAFGGLAALDRSRCTSATSLLMNRPPVKSVFGCTDTAAAPNPRKS